MPDDSEQDLLPGDVQSHIDDHMRPLTRAEEIGIRAFAGFLFGVILNIAEMPGPSIPGRLVVLIGFTVVGAATGYFALQAPGFSPNGLQTILTRNSTKPRVKSRNYVFYLSVVRLTHIYGYAFATR